MDYAAMELKSKQFGHELASLQALNQIKLD